MTRRPYLTLIVLVAAVLVANADRNYVLSKLKEHYGDFVTKDYVKGVTEGTTKAGDTATGAILDEQEKGLLLDTKPCKGKTLRIEDPGAGEVRLIRSLCDCKELKPD